MNTNKWIDINKIQEFKEQYFWPYYVPHNEVIKKYNENENLKKRYCILKNSKQESSFEFMSLKWKIIR